MCFYDIYICNVQAAFFEYFIWSQFMTYENALLGPFYVVQIGANSNLLHYFKGDNVAGYSDSIPFDCIMNRQGFYYIMLWKHYQRINVHLMSLTDRAVGTWLIFKAHWCCMLSLDFRHSRTVSRLRASTS